MRSVLCAFTALLMTAASAQAVVPFESITGQAPLTTINLGSDLSCQVTAQGDPHPSFEEIDSTLGDCGTYVFVTNTATGQQTLFGPSDRVFLPAPDQPYTPDTSVGPNGQNKVDTGNGTTAVESQVVLGSTGLRVTRTDVYTNGQDFYSSGIDVADQDPSNAYDVTVSHLFLCYLQGGTGGDFGFHQLYLNSLEQPGCATGPGVSPARTESLTALAAPVSWDVINYGDTGSALRAGTFPNTCECAIDSDLMVGLSWTRHLDPGGSTSTDIAFQTRSSGPQGAPAPQPEKTGTASTQSGTVLVQAPGGQFVPLSGNQSIPVGSLVDTRNGVVRLTVAASGKAKTRTGTFGGGIFRFTQARQKRLLVTRLALRGGSFAVCGARSVLGDAARRRVVRYLKAKATGSFAVIGKNSSGIERGTRWTTTDRCDGTLTAVQQGTVAVTDFARHKTVLVRAGHSYLARPGR